MYKACGEGNVMGILDFVEKHVNVLLLLTCCVFFCSVTEYGLDNLFTWVFVVLVFMLNTTSYLDGWVDGIQRGYYAGKSSENIDNQEDA